MASGCALLTDDVLAIQQCRREFLGRPSYPQMRMWPEEAHHFLGHYQDLDVVHQSCDKRRVPVGADSFGDFCEVSQPLACIYAPEQRDPRVCGTTIDIAPLAPQDAVMKLVQYSFVPRVVEAMGLQPQRLDLFARLIREVPMRSLSYPSGFEHLPRVRDAILEDLTSLLGRTSEKECHGC
jgi:hypothetical protein